MTTKVKLEGVSKYYLRGKEKVSALKNVNLEINTGEFVTIMGSSGSGKSTLLHLIGGLDTPSEGEIHIDDIPISSWKDDQLTLFRREKLGFVFQFFNLIPTLTVEENAALPLLLMGIPKEEWKPKVDELLKKVGLENRKNHYPSELSGGQMQRVAIVRGIINKPMLLLADEPTGNLDTKTGEEVLFLLKSLTEDNGITLLLVTHDPKVAAYGNRVITIKDGEVIEVSRGRL